MKTRILLAGLAAVVAMAFSASSAFAVTAGPFGQHVATSGTAAFKVDGFEFACESSKIPTVATPDGVLHVLTPNFTKCNSYFGLMSVSSTSTIRDEMAFDQNGLNSTLANINLTFSNTACKFSISGYESTTNLGFSPLTVSNLVFPNSSPSTPTLKLTSFPEANHCFNFLTLNSPVEFSANYTISPPLTVTK